MSISDIRNSHYYYLSKKHLKNYDIRDAIDITIVSGKITK